ncbi:Cof-type HAD-IIB family hydrolase [Thaumasiovibrio subtropicus]|uniref:Cof-type HAD-IIB family hydrolase n=1 Tax=Thaumasiovibrio subtropicus TaxID=1891207 RepID=UPI000B35D9E8|nr:Cof-type HAD-IIB family hydrolase [Thaumasiovibrio subtropicus]
MYKIIASDLDGTLLTPEHVIAPYSRGVLQQLHQRGEHFVFATGRHHVDVARIRETVGIPAYMITSNGARVHDADDNLVFAADVDPEVVHQLLAICKDDENIIIHFYHDEQWMVSRLNEELKKFHKDSGFSYKILDLDAPPTDKIVKIFLTYDDHEYLVEFEKKFNATFGDNASIAFSTPWCLEVMGKGVSKGAALQAVAELKGYTLADCIAFGDGMNDKEMLEMAGKGLIMGTAHDRLKNALPALEIIGDNKEESVARYLETHLFDITDR